VDARLFELGENMVLPCQDALDNHVVDTRPKQVHVDMDRFQVLAEGG
jgi:hypothetical protein